MDNKFNVNGFLNEIIDVCKKYNLSISHEDSQGSFIIEKYDEYNIDWLKECSVNLEGEHFHRIEDYLRGKEKYEYGR